MGLQSSSKLYYRTFVTSCVGIMVMISCQKDPNSNVDCTGVIPTYSADIKAILDESCALSGCHNSVSQQAGIDLTNYADAKSISSQERFLAAIRHQNGFEPMPQNSAKLSDEKIDLLACWVENGSPE